MRGNSKQYWWGNEPIIVNPAMANAAIRWCTKETDNGDLTIGDGIQAYLDYQYNQIQSL